MGTRGNIAVILKEEDLRKEKLVFNKELIPIKYDLKTFFAATHEPLYITRLNGADRICVYVQFDAYPSGVGKVLMENYETYEKALNLVVGGSVEGLCIGYQSILESRRTDIALHRFGDVSGFNEEYSYLFTDGRWWVRFNDVFYSLRSRLENAGIDWDGVFKVFLPLEDVLGKGLKERFESVSEMSEEEKKNLQSTIKEFQKQKLN